ncbi:MAG: site-specific DNA-methyltransferase [Paludibacteraceae bacterium]|nr:site-specific DNA-methyltransferase [Paludibacteraceae bacterium]
MELHNRDCFEIMKSIPDNSIDFVFTDPPYYFRGHQNRGIGTEGSSKYANSEMFKEGNKLSQMGSFDGNDVYRLLDECDRVLKNFRGYFFCNEYLVPYYTMWALEHNYLFCIITLEKPLSVINRNRYSTNAEFMIRIYKSGEGINVLDYDKKENHIEWLSAIQPFDRIQDKVHPAEKPLDLLEGVLRLNTKEGDTILDPFMGSGTIGMVCKKMNLQYIGIEIDSHYFDLAIMRIENVGIEMEKASKLSRLFKKS